MEKLKIKYFFLLVLCAVFFASADKRGGGFIVRDGCLGPALKQSDTAVFIDESTKREIKESVYRASGVVAAADMNSFFADVVIKKESLFRDYEKLMTEARILSELAANPETSAYVPKVYSVTEEAGQPAIIMEDISRSKPPFVEMLEDNTFLSFREQLLVVRETVSAMSAIHKAGYIHHDIYPTNIFYRFELLDDGSERVHVKIIDFEWSFQTSAPVYSMLSMNSYGNLSRIYYDLSDLSLEERIVHNVRLDIESAARCFLKFFRDHYTGGALYDLSASELALLEKVEDRWDFVPMLEIIPNPLVRELLIRMLISLSADDQYASLEPVITILTEVISQMPSDSSVLCSA